MTIKGKKNNVRYYGKWLYIVCNGISDHVISQLRKISKSHSACTKDHVTRHMHVELHNFNFTLNCHHPSVVFLPPHPPTPPSLEAQDGGAFSLPAHHQPLPSSSPTSPSLAQNARRRGCLLEGMPQTARGWVHKVCPKLFFSLFLLT